MLKTKLEELQGNSNPLPAYQTLMMGFVSGACGPLFNAPIDVIKTRIQKNPSKESGWTRFTQITSGIIKNEGWTAFYKGTTPRVLRVAPGQAITFMVYENVYRTLNEFSKSLSLTDAERVGITTAETNENSIDKEGLESAFLTAIHAESNEAIIMESGIRDNKRRYAAVTGVVLATVLLVSLGLGFGLPGNTPTANNHQAFAANDLSSNPCANVLDNTVVCLSLDTFTQCYSGATNPTQPVAHGTECCLGEMVFAGTCNGPIPVTSATTSRKASNSASSIRRRKTSTDSSAVATDAAQAPASSTTEVSQPATTAFQAVQVEVLLTTADVPAVPSPAPVPTTTAVVDIPIPAPVPIPTTAAVVATTAAARATTSPAVQNSNASGSSSSAKVLISGSGA
ncbi:hypothetical protein HDU98_005307, partial [Podochytrium sp. JEL0797]